MAGDSVTELGCRFDSALCSNAVSDCSAGQHFSILLSSLSVTYLWFAGELLITAAADGMFVPVLYPSMVQVNPAEAETPERLRPS